MISQEKIMQIVREYAKSPQGKKAIKEKYGIEYDEKFDFSMALKYANQMKAILYDHIHPLIKSIQLDDIVIDEPRYDKSGLHYISISFAEGSLHRDSMVPNKYPDGLHNIILLFKNGYHASNEVHGDWTFRGEVVARNIYGRADREPNGFLDDAVAEFNKLSKGVAVAALEGDYSK